MIKKNILLIGSTGTIGSAIKKELKDHNITLLDRDNFDLEYKSINMNIELDKPIDSVIFTAGINLNLNQEDLNAFSKRVDLEKHFSVNVASLVQIIAHFKKYIKYGASITAISSIYGKVSRKNRISYCVSKHALNGVIKSLALELAERGIKVNSVSPGFIESVMTSKNNSKKKLTNLKSKIPLGRLGIPEEVAELVKFLVEKNTYINGQDIVIDGGYLAGGFENE